MRPTDVCYVEHRDEWNHVQVIWRLGGERFFISTRTHTPLSNTTGCEFLQAQEASPFFLYALDPLPPLGGRPSPTSVTSPIVCLTFLGSQPLWESDGGCGPSSGETRIALSVLCLFVEAYKFPEANPWSLQGLKSHLGMHYIIALTCYKMVAFLKNEVRLRNL